MFIKKTSRDHYETSYNQKYTRRYLCRIPKTSINKRSIDSHARYTVTNSVTSKIKQIGSEMYQHELTDRPNYLMFLVKNVPTEINLHPALLAERLGEKIR